MSEKPHAVVKISIPKERSPHCLSCLQTSVGGCHQENMMEIGDLQDGNQFILARMLETNP